MKVRSILAGIAGLAAVFCACTKNNPEQEPGKEPEKEPVAVAEVKLDAESFTLAKGLEKKLSATVSPEDAEYEAVVWSSEDEGVATVDQEGLVKAVGLGTTKIKAAAGEKYAECEVTVYIAATGIFLDKTELELSLGGTAVKLVATVEPWNVSESEKVISWSSDAPEIATVDQEGTVTPVAVGEAVVTAKCGEFTAECKVTVAAPAKVWAIGDYYEEDGNKGVVCWVSDDAQHGKIVSLDQKDYCVWSKSSDNTGAKSETDGKGNTEKVKDAFSFVGYDSFKWCADHGDGWYFPSVYEVTDFMVNAEAINKTLAEHGGVKISDYYWSSTEAEEDSTSALYVYYSKYGLNGVTSSYGDFKTDPEEGGYLIRAMYEF